MPITAGSVKFALAQINSTVGDVAGNVAKIIAHAQRAQAAGAAVAVFPELAVSGYPPEDLLLRDDFIGRCERGVAEIAAAAPGVVIVGHPLRARGKLYNALSVLQNGQTRAQYRKRRLPNHGVFDEPRYFHTGRAAQVVDLNDARRGHRLRVGLLICEDLWHAAPLRESVAAGAELIICVNASPFHRSQPARRERKIVLKQARARRVPILYLNCVGGQDELVFDGGSIVADANGEVAARLPAFTETMAVVGYRQGKFRGGVVAPRPPPTELLYRAIVLGVRDYFEKNHFSGALLGLSGGVDSALTLAVAVDALGAERVWAVMLPSKYTADISRQDARRQAEDLGVRYAEISIEPMVRVAGEQLAPLFAGRAPDLTEENIQARARGLTLMALSNKFNLLVLNTANKSELAVGFATLYGDMVGGFAPLKDVYKTAVYELAEYRNAIAAVIPKRILARAPSAELAAGQVDLDRLPPYEILDAILQMHIEEDRSAAEIIAAGFAADTVRTVLAMVRAGEYKRRQAAPGVRVTAKAFGKDRRYPITSGFNPAAPE